MCPIAKLENRSGFDWRATPEDYFDFRIPDAFNAQREEVATETAPGQWRVELDGRRGAALTFNLDEQVVGWPGFTIEAPAGTTIELLVHEAHAPGGPPLAQHAF